MTRLLFVVGLQKSGTTLLSRLLQQHQLALNPFRTEGNDFWGNEPPFSPTAEPAGRIYQQHGGERGHEIGAESATPEVRHLLERRLADLGAREGIWLNKNPYNTVRLPWLRALFPDSIIVALVRTPLANVYSLAKKHVPHEQAGLAPEEGWWGVKPARWRELRDPNTALQCARQWSHVNGKLWEDRALVDRLIEYPELCAHPAEILAELVSLCGGAAPAERLEVEPLQCFDHEFQRGSRLRSKNRYFKERGGLDVPAEEPIEFEAFDPASIEAIEKECAETEERLRGLRSTR